MCTERTALTWACVDVRVSGAWQARSCAGERRNNDIIISLDVCGPQRQKHCNLLSLPFITGQGEAIIVTLDCAERRVHWSSRATSPRRLCQWEKFLVSRSRKLICLRCWSEWVSWDELALRPLGPGKSRGNEVTLVQLHHVRCALIYTENLSNRSVVKVL